jgi:hypothetical protein
MLVTLAPPECGVEYDLVPDHRPADIGADGRDHASAVRAEGDRELAVVRRGPHPRIAAVERSRAQRDGYFAAAWFSLRQVGQLEAGRIPELHQS